MGGFLTVAFEFLFPGDDGLDDSAQVDLVRDLGDREEKEVAPGGPQLPNQHVMAARGR